MRCSKHSYVRPFFRPLIVPLIACLFAGPASAAPSPQKPFPGSSIPQFKQALPLLSVQDGTIDAALTFDPDTGLPTTSFEAPLELSICEFKANILPVGTFAKGKTPPPASVWGYLRGAACPDPSTVKDTYLGPVLVNLKGAPTTIRFTNGLPTVKDTNVLAYKYGTDQTVHWADPLNGEDNMCHMMSGDPPQVGVGIPPYPPASMSQCSRNYGEDLEKPGTFLPVGIPAVPHLHGGEVPPVLDGGPSAWFMSYGSATGHGYYTAPASLVSTALNQAVYRYPNSQGAAPIWFHDHTLGATRLNVYAGIAGGYYILDPEQETHFQQIKMRPVEEVIPLILQDRQFDTDGQLYYPTDFPGGLNGPSPNPEHPYWNPEFLGDVIVINGKAWPNLNVEPRRYRFLFLNGSNARTYEMFLVNPSTKVMGPVMWVIGNDGGFLDKPSIINPNAAKPIEPHLIVMPGERYEVIIDFGGLPAGTKLVLKNVAKAPYPGGATPQGATLGQMMQFTVIPLTAPDTSYDPATGVGLRPTPMVRLTNPATGTLASGVTIAKTRELTLNEVALVGQTAIDPVTGVSTAYLGGPVEILVNNSLFAGKDRPDFTPVTIGGVTEYVSETPKEGDTELWEIVNTTMDAHPIHTHLATFQILNRQNYNQKAFTAAYNLLFPATPSECPGSRACPPVCTGGVYCPAYGPPLDYDKDLNPKSGGKYGGNPDVTPYLTNAIQLPDPDEVGWKDTVMAPPGMVTRFVVRFAPTETAVGTIAGYPFLPNDGTDGSVGDSHGYVWHCHIIDHEDNEMMRPDVIVPLRSATRTYVKGTDY